MPTGALGGERRVKVMLEDGSTQVALLEEANELKLVLQETPQVFSFLDRGPPGPQGLQGPAGNNADATAAIETHRIDTTAVHGITDTASLVLTSDARLTNARTPTGTAGGVLSGDYPNPEFSADMATQAELDSVESTGSLVAIGVDGLGNPEVELAASNFGIDSNGDPYFDAAGAVTAERAHLYINGDDDFALILIGG